MNKPTRSKINYTAVLVQITTILFIAGVIPAEFQEPVIALIGLVAPTVIQVFRTWFTGPKS